MQAVVGPSRLEVRITRGILELRSWYGDGEAVDPRQLDVEQNEVGLELPAASTAVSPFSASPTTSYPSASSSVLARCPEARVVVDDQNCHSPQSRTSTPRPNTVTHTLYCVRPPLTIGFTSVPGPPWIST
jgi:hypothetical protein